MLVYLFRFFVLVCVSVCVCLTSSFSVHRHDFERMVDDFVFMCFFCGNDFLPHLPSLSIHEGALDMLIDMYKAILPILGGYMTNAGEVRCLSCMYVFISLLILMCMCVCVTGESDACGAVHSFYCFV